MARPEWTGPWRLLAGRWWIRPLADRPADLPPGRRASLQPGFGWVFLGPMLQWDTEQKKLTVVDETRNGDPSAIVVRDKRPTVSAQQGCDECFDLLSRSVRTLRAFRMLDGRSTGPAVLGAEIAEHVREHGVR